jgi:hypothetical protein
MVMQRIEEHLVQANAVQIAEFFSALDARLGRTIRRIVVIPLYGRINEFISVEEALDFLDRHAIYEGSGEFRKYEIVVEFSNGSRIDAFFSSKSEVRDFLSFVTTR